MWGVGIQKIVIFKSGYIFWKSEIILCCFCMRVFFLFTSYEKNCPMQILLVIQMIVIEYYCLNNKSYCYLGGEYAIRKRRQSR